MPNRILREGINDSKAVNSLSDSGEIFYRRLMSLVDDFGRYEADPELLRAKLFARQLDRWTVDRVSQALAEVSGVLTDDGHPLVIVYRSGKYLQVNKFDQRVRAQKSKCPPPDSECLTNDSQMTALACATTPSPSTPSSVVVFPKVGLVPADAESGKGGSVTDWTAAGFVGPEDGEMWFFALTGKHPNRKSHGLARTRFLELVMLGQFNRAEFERWYESKLRVWKDWPQFPNLQTIFLDCEWRFPDAAAMAPAVDYSDPKRYGPQGD
jgi:hypothetical protein